MLRADFTVTGLPETDSLMVRLPDFYLASGRKDIRMLAGELVPEEITLPDSFNLQLAFDGMLNAFDTEAELESSYGDLLCLVQVYFLYPCFWYKNPIIKV